MTKFGTLFYTETMPSGGQNAIVRTQEISEKIIEMFKEGKTYAQVSDAVGVKISIIQDWIIHDAQFGSTCLRALQQGYEIHADSLVTIHEDIPDFHKATLKSNNLKWLLARRLASKYGDRLDLTVNQTVSISDALVEAKRRISSNDTIDGELVEPLPLPVPDDDDIFS